MSKDVTVLGAGSFGTAIAQLLAENGYTVHLWDHDSELVHFLAAYRENKKYLPGIELDANIHPISDLGHAVCDAKWVFEAIPVGHLRSVLERARSCVHPDQVWIVLSKGIENKTLLFPTQVLDDVFDYEVKKAVLAGPSFAREIMQHQITAVTIGALDFEIGQKVQQMVSNDFFQASITDDVIGVQAGAAFKNVISLGMGMLDGAGYRDNTKAFFFTLGLQEEVRCAVALGGNAHTLYGFSGVGDLVLTSMGASSRNLEVGKRIGKGESVETIIEQTGYTVEGLNTLNSMMALAKKYEIQMPVSLGIAQVVNGEKTVEQMIMGMIAHAHI